MKKLINSAEESKLTNIASSPEISTKAVLQKLLVRLLIVLLLLFVIDQIVGVAFDQLRHYSLQHGKTKLVTEYTMQKVQDDVLILGNSRAAHHYVPAILEDSLKMTVYNCGNDGKSFAYSAAMIHSVLQRYSPRLIVLDVENELFDPVLNEYFQSDVLYPYYDSDSLIRSILLHEDPLNRYKLRSMMYRNNSQLIDILKYMFVQYPFVRGYDPLPNEGYQYPSIRKEEYSMTAPADSFMLELLRFTSINCRRMKVPLVLVVSPKYQQSNANTVPSFTAMAEMCRQYGIPLLDYGDYRAIGDSTYFKDANHLNRKGAEEFTRKLASELVRTQLFN